MVRPRGLTLMRRSSSVAVVVVILLLAEAQPGDLVVVFQSGAYGFTASPHGFLSHPTPVEVLC